MKYHICYGMTRTQLMSDVEEWIKIGYVPIGGVCATDDQILLKKYMQAMIKKETNSHSMSEAFEARP
jgi:hypothetical protein